MTWPLQPRKRPLKVVSGRPGDVHFQASQPGGGPAVIHPQQPSRLRPNPATRIALRASPKQPFVRRSATSAWNWGASPLLMTGGTIAILLAPGCFLILPIVIHVDDHGPSATSAHPEVP
jgi:hypothetical protein